MVLYKLINKLFFVIGLPLSTYIFAADDIANNYISKMTNKTPDEFKYLLLPAEKIITIVLANDDSLKLNAEISRYQVKLTSNESLDKLRKFLQENGIKNSAIDSLIEMFSSGAISSLSCKGERNKCDVFANNELAVVVDDVLNKVRLIIPQSFYINNSGELTYEQNHNYNPAIINKPSFYVSRDYKYWNSLLNNKSIIGLPYGHINSEFYLSKSKSSTFNTFNELTYNLNLNKYSIQLGRADNPKNKNSTSLINFINKKFEGVYLYTTNNLTSQPIENMQRLFYFMPGKGTIEIFKDRQLVYSSTTEGGSNYVSYKDLPYGSYDINLVRKVNGEIIGQESLFIVNNNSFSLNKDGHDFSFGVGRLLNHSLHNDNQQYQVFDSSFSYRPYERALVAAGLLYHQDERFYKLGVKLIPSSNLNITFGSGVFSDRSYLLTSSISYGTVTLTMNKYESHNANNHSSNTTVKKDKVIDNHKFTQSSISSFLFGDDDTQQMVLSGQWGIEKHNFYGSLMFNDVKTNKSYSMANFNYNLYYSYLMPKDITISLNMGVNNNVMRTDKIARNYNDKYIGVNLTIPFSNGFNISLSSQQTERNQSSTFNINKNIINDNSFSSDVNVMQTFTTGVKSQSYAAIGFNKYNSSFNASSNIGYHSENGTSGYLSLDSTQILTYDGLYYTNKQSDSYLVVRDQSNNSLFTDNSPLKSQVTIGDGNMTLSNKIIDSGSTTLEALDNYKIRTIKVNPVTGGIFNQSNSEINTFTLPGSVYILNTNFNKEFQLIAAFYDEDNNFVNEIQCNGQSCGRSERIDDGVYKLYFKGNEDFNLTSNGKTCITSSDIKLVKDITKIERIECIKIKPTLNN
ncbi:hypothetical protein S479_22425 [Salmonella enterica subsp. enterica serovar Newport]|nr:hypothetical protein [Salmonella enterica subsp. enterica serovar Newport]